MAEMNRGHIYAIQILFVCGITIGSQNIDFDNKHNWLANVARYVLYLLIIRGSQDVCVFVYNLLHNKESVDMTKSIEEFKSYIVMFGASGAILFYSKQKIFGEDFLLLFIAYLVVKFPQVEKKSETISYGVGMACSFFEGYLAHVLPSDGHRFVGFQENINKYEAKQGVVFPVRRLFIIITKSMYCPPDLKEFNKENKFDIPHLEACQVSPDESLEEVEKDVAGVKNRIYRNSAYMIRRPRGRPPVFLAAECATPLHTLHRVTKNRSLYEELANINKDQVVKDFCSTLQSIILKSEECKNKCELVYYDDEDPKQNLADVLLEKIRELEPDFEQLIIRQT